MTFRLKETYACNPEADGQMVSKAPPHRILFTVSEEVFYGPNRPRRQHFSHQEFEKECEIFAIRLALFVENQLLHELMILSGSYYIEFNINSYLRGSEMFMEVCSPEDPEELLFIEEVQPALLPPR